VTQTTMPPANPGQFSEHRLPFTIHFSGVTTAETATYKAADGRTTRSELSELNSKPE
jgi:hypothetical protein